MLTLTDLVGGEVRGSFGGSCGESNSSIFFFRYTEYVCPMISSRGTVIVKIMKMSIIFT